MSASLLEVVPPQAAGRAWLVSFVDLILLLLTFFVLMFSMSRPDPAKFPLPLEQQAATPTTLPDPEPTFSRARTFVAQGGGHAEDLAYLETALQRVFSQSSTLRTIQFRNTEQYLMLTLPAEDVQQGLLDASVPGTMLFDLAGLLANIDNGLAVIGIADQSAESWEVAVRASARVAGLLQRAGYDRPIATLAKAGVTQTGSVEIMIMAESMTVQRGAP